MNCQDVNEILDQLRFDRIEPGRRQQVEVHVAGCPDCARSWNAQLALASLPDEPMPEGLARRCLAAVVAHVAGSASTRRHGHRRLLVWGSLTAVAAAAITLLWLPGDESATVHSRTVVAAGTEAKSTVVNAAPAEPAGVAGDSAPRLPEAVAAGLAEGPRITVEVSVREPVPMGPETLQPTASDSDAREMRESLRAALVGELRAIPGLEVVQEVPEQLVAPARHYRLQVISIQMIGVDSKPMRLDSHPMNLGVQEVKSGNSTIPLGRNIPFAIDPVATCTLPDEPAKRPCNVSATAAFLVHQLREKIFPADASVTRPLQARFRNFSLAPDERFQAFVELFRLQANTGGKDLLGDPQMVRAAVELSQLTDAKHRAQLWRALRGIGNPDLIDPLLTSLQQDSREARIAAAETLALDFHADPRVQAALESAASADPHAMVRALARRGLAGEGAWQAYVTSSLKDSGRPASEQVEALLHVLYPPDTIPGIDDGSPASYRQTLQDLDDASVKALAEAFPEAEQLRKWPGNNLLSNFANAHARNPAVKKMLLTVLEQDTQASNRSVAGEVLAMRHAGDPQVRQALTRAARSDPEARVRDYLRQVLDRDSVKKAMEAASR